MRYFRAFLGPIFEHPREPLFFLASLITLSALLVAQMWFFDDAYFGVVLSLIAAIPLFFVSRLVLRWRCLYRCRRRLEEVVGRHALALMVRLSDEEIMLFSRLSAAQIKAWIAEQKESCFRWGLYSTMYSNSR